MISMNLSRLPVAVLIDARNLLGGNRWIPRARQQRSNNIELRSEMKQSLAEANRFVLMIGSVACHESDLTQSELESCMVSRLSVRDQLIKYTCSS